LNSIFSISSIFLNIEEPYIEESILRKSISSIYIEDSDRGFSIPNTALLPPVSSIVKGGKGRMLADLVCRGTFGRTLKSMS
jgi:hypothetical protein